MFQENMDKRFLYNDKQLIIWASTQQLECSSNNQWKIWGLNNER